MSSRDFTLLCQWAHKLGSIPFSAGLVESYLAPVFSRHTLSRPLRQEMHDHHE
jgi:hypothetical protein